jgi:hypothetical protein
MARQQAEADDTRPKDEASLRVASHRDFHHPYTPYEIQETFMSTVYQVLDEGKVGILESPTGTVSAAYFVLEFKRLNLKWLRSREHASIIFIVLNLAEALR